MPTPRTAEEGAAAGMLSYIAESVRELDRSLERGLEGIRQQLGELPKLYVPRIELDRRFDELYLDVGEAKAAAAAAVAAQATAEAARQERERELTRERRTFRLALAGLAFTATSTTAGLVFGLLSNLS